MIRAVLFDLDGLMIDTEPIHFRAFRAFMREFDVDLPESMMPEFIGYNEIDNIRLLKQKYRLAEPLEALVMKRRGIYGRLLETEDIPALPGFWEVFEEATRRGIKRGVVSSSIQPQVEVPLRRLCQQRFGSNDLGRCFDVIVTGDDVAFTKPAPDSYLLALDRLEIVGKEAIAFEDTPAGVRAAATAGITVYAVPNEYTRHLPFPEAAAILGSLTEAVPLLNEGSRELPVES